MDFAYINYKDNPVHKKALADLTQHLENREIRVFATNEPYQNIKELQSGPFINFQNPFIRLIPCWPVYAEKKLLDFHRKIPFSKIISSSNEIISINPLSTDDYSFRLLEKATYILSEDAFNVNLCVPKKKRALLTSLQDGSPYLDIWLKYYSKYFDEKDIYFVCCNTPDAMKDKLKDYSIITSKINLYSMRDKLALLNCVQKELLDHHELVMYADIDEIVFHEKGLSNILNILPTNITRCEGYDIVHLRNREPYDLDLSRPIISQRNFWAKSPQWDKPIILKKPSLWELGLHGLNIPNNIQLDAVANYYPGLYLIHLRSADFKIANMLTTKNRNIGIQLVHGGRECLYIDNELITWWEGFEKISTPIPQNIKEVMNF